ncbi:MAG: DUF3800 domain-containing protein [Nitrospinae bacterium]|nr:DUF3800 domain-containing protein [Nitrospinota bacterium]
MHLFLDESGDTGFKFRQGSTPVFVIALVVVNDPAPLDHAVERIRHQYRLAPSYEFKFSKTADRLKERFFRGIQDHLFYVRAIVIDKTMIYSDRLREKHWFYNYVTKLVLKHDDGLIHEATLVVDKRLPGIVNRRPFDTYLRRELNSGRRRLKAIKHADSARENLLQVADMVAGAIHRRYGPRQDASYLGLMSRQITDPRSDIWEFGLLK